MVDLQRIAIAVLGCCLLGCQEEPETTEPQGTEATQARETEQKGTWDADSLVETKLTASDAAEHDTFGSSVAINGNMVIVGSPNDKDAGEDSGSAYLFDVMGNQRFKLIASDAAEEDLFGFSVATSGNRAIVGAIFDDDGGHWSGSAYLFDVSNGNQLFKLTPSDAAVFDQFGWSVAISGNRAIVGTNAREEDESPRSGAAYLFDVNIGHQLFKLTASDASQKDYFGTSVAISGNMAIVGAHRSAYLFDVTTGNQLFKLTPSDALENEAFGRSVAISGNRAIVGAPRVGIERDADGGAAGAAYVFDVTTGNQLFKLTDPNTVEFNDGFGSPAAISGNRAIVGTSRSRAYLFDVATGDLIAELTAPNTGNDFFGRSVAISGNTAIVGAFWASPDSIHHAGAAYLFTSEP